MHIFLILIVFRHIFHKSCVDPWLLDQRSCPMCKLDILRAYGMHISHVSVLPKSLGIVRIKAFDR